MEFQDYTTFDGIKIVNLCPHPIDVALPRDNYESVAFTIPKSGVISRCASSDKEVTSFGDSGAIPGFKSELGAVDIIPESRDGVIYVASAAVAEKLNRKDVVAPGPQTIREDGSRFCRGVKVYGY